MNNLLEKIEKSLFKSKSELNDEQFKNIVNKIYGKILEEAPYARNSDLSPAVKKYPSGAQTAFRKAFNSALEHYKDEQIAFRVAWKVLKDWLKKNK